MEKQSKQRLEQLVRQGLVPSRKLPILMQAMSSLHMGKQLTPTERDILAKYMHNMTDIMLKDTTVFNRTKIHTQRTKYQTEETTVDLDEKMVDGVEVVDGPEAEEKMKSKKAKKKDEVDDMKESRGIDPDQEERMRRKEENKARRLSIRKRDKFRMLPSELKKEKMKAGVEEEFINFNAMYKEQFEAALEYYGIDNIRDLPEEKKAEFFNLVDLALEEAKMAKKDHDGDGKVETSTAEYMGSRDKAIKKAMKKEEVEQVDELKKSTLSSYIQKAADPVAKKSNVNLGSKAAYKLATSDDMEAGKKEDRKAFVRSKGIQTAAKKLAKEEVELEEGLPPHLKKIFDKKGNIDPKKVSKEVHGGKKSDAKVTDVTPKGYGPKEEVEFEEEYTHDHFKKDRMAKVKSTGEAGRVISRYRHDDGEIHYTLDHGGNKTSRHPGKNLQVHKEETAQLSEDDRLEMIRRAAERVKSGEVARDRAKRAEKAARADMKQKGAQKGMAPTKKDVEEQVMAIRKIIKEGSAKEKIEAYKELNTIIEQFKTTGEQ